jgi:hypothetical protein
MRFKNIRKSEDEMPFNQLKKKFPANEEQVIV